jgi:hypothetical protein
VHARSRRAVSRHSQPDSYRCWLSKDRQMLLSDQIDSCCCQSSVHAHSRRVVSSYSHTGGYSTWLCVDRHLLLSSRLLTG